MEETIECQFGRIVENLRKFEADIRREENEYMLLDRDGLADVISELANVVDVTVKFTRPQSEVE